jgi:hypothetical protein
LPFLTLLLSNWRTVGVLVLVAAIGSYVAVLRIQRDEARADFKVEHAAFETFKVKVAAEGEIARQRAEAIAAHDGLLKEEADEDHRQAVDRLHADVARMRDERDRARGDFLSAATSCPGSAAAAERRGAEYQRAYRDLVDGLRAQGDRGDANRLGLNNGKDWARERGRVP